jgi:hypothetical protein
MSVPNVYLPPIVSETGRPFFTALVGPNDQAGLTVLVPLGAEDAAPWILAEVEGDAANEAAGSLTRIHADTQILPPPCWLREELRLHPWIVPGLALTASAAFGSALPDILAFVARVL